MVYRGDRRVPETSGQLGCASIRSNSLGRGMAEQIPITPALVTWARERAGLSLDQAVQTFRRIDEWEKGASFPTYAQLEQLSDAFKLPIAVFFFPEPPKVPPIQETFRTLDRKSVV